MVIFLGRRGIDVETVSSSGLHAISLNMNMLDEHKNSVDLEHVVERLVSKGFAHKRMCQQGPVESLKSSRSLWKVQMKFYTEHLS